VRVRARGECAAGEMKERVGGQPTRACLGRGTPLSSLAPAPGPGRGTRKPIPIARLSSYAPVRPFRIHAWPPQTACSCPGPRFWGPGGAGRRADGAGERPLSAAIGGARVDTKKHRRTWLMATGVPGAQAERGGFRKKETRVRARYCVRVCECVCRAPRPATRREPQLRSALLVTMPKAQRCAAHARGRLPTAPPTRAAASPSEPRSPGLSTSEAHSG